jgi:hypothetical protein
MCYDWTEVERTKSQIEAIPSAPAISPIVHGKIEGCFEVFGT